MEIISLIISILAIVGSFISIFISKRQIYSSIISTKHFEWMDNMRNRLSEFFDVYFDERISIYEKNDSKRYQIELYIDTRGIPGCCNDDFIKIKNSLSNCIFYCEDKEIRKNILTNY